MIPSVKFAEIDPISIYSCLFLVLDLNSLYSGKPGCFRASHFDRDEMLQNTEKDNNV